MSIKSLVNSDHNPQNKNAGNGGDLVKHSVYLGLLDELLKQDPWRGTVRLHECHAGQGVYKTSVTRRRLVKALADTGAETVLGRFQRDALAALNLGSVDSGDYYAGSAVLNLRTLSGRRGSAEFYEMNPDTRNLLVTTLNKVAAIRDGFDVWIPGLVGKSFDGEMHIGAHISDWDERDVVLLDPFAMWSKPQDQHRRSVFRQILMNATDRGCPLSLFFTWGRDNLTAARDINRESVGPPDGYVDLLANLQEASANVVIVNWTWGLRFAMWLILPTLELRDAVAKRLQSELRALDEFAIEAHMRRVRPRTEICILKV